MSRLDSTPAQQHHAPREIQEAAFRQGFIPSIPET